MSANVMVGVRSTSNVGEVIYSLLRMQPPEISSITGLCVLDTLTATSKISLAAGLQLSVALAMVVVYLFGVGGVACVRWLQVGTWACWLCVKPLWWDWGLGTGCWGLGTGCLGLQVGSSMCRVRLLRVGTQELWRSLAQSHVVGGWRLQSLLGACVCGWLVQGCSKLAARSAGPRQVAPDEADTIQQVPASPSAVEAVAEPEGPGVCLLHDGPRSGDVTGPVLSCSFAGLFALFT
jgi:hypothetical protein